ncbi:MAG: hypothetical protein ACMXYF_02885 [Candidatus Woesearchaeota archaeon]
MSDFFFHVGNLQYDVLSDVVLQTTKDNISAHHLDRAWSISVPYMDANTKHPRMIEGFGSVRELSDYLVQVYGRNTSAVLLGNDLARQATKDRANGKIQLARELFAASTALQNYPRVQRN